MNISIKSLLLTSIFSFTLLSQIIHAQNNNDDNDNDNDNETENTDVTSNARAFWEADLPGGNYMVSLTRIASISIHSYLVNQTFMVHEVNIVTRGNGLARFYAFEVPGEGGALNVAKNVVDRGKDLLSRGGGRAGVDPGTTVEKEYPTTTHAGTIEYKLVDKADLDQLYSSVKRAFRENRGRKFTIR